MRDSVLKQRSECNRKFHKKSDYPEEFENIWGTRKVSDYPSRKHAGFAVFLIMNQEIKTLKEQLEDALQLIRRIKNACSPSDIATCEQALKDFLKKQDKENKDEK